MAPWDQTDLPRLPEMSRRAFLAITAGGLLAAPLAAEAQQAGNVYRIGFLATSLATGPHLTDAFRQGLRDLGYVEGRTVVIEYRDAEGKLERLPALAAELVALKVNVIVAPNTPAAWPPSERLEPSPLFSLVLANRWRADSLPAWPGRAAMSRGCPSSPRS